MGGDTVMQYLAFSPHNKKVLGKIKILNFKYVLTIKFATKLNQNKAAWAILMSRGVLDFTVEPQKNKNIYGFNGCRV